MTVKVQGTRLELRVVGSAVLNEALSVGQTPGSGVIMTVHQLHAVLPEAAVNGYLIRLAPGVDRDAAYTTLRREFGPTVLRPQSPTQVENVVRVRSLPMTLAALVGGASALLLGYALVATVRNRRRDLAVLKAIGASRRQVAGSIAWQALLMVGIALAVALPLGIAAGRVAWQWANRSFGTVADPHVPLGRLSVVAVASVVVAGVVAVIPALIAAATPTARVLRRD